ncbi:MAG TPA: hypothetical protein VGY55_25150 [Pirellulales bacterium]|jgi:chromosome segregation ATPase|nr:hypothetical protein [Pirellulales bacterium]
MQGPAYVNSIAAIQNFKNALVMYVAESNQGTTNLETEIRRAYDWIAVDRAQYWRNEIRRANDAVVRAKDELHHARTFKRIDDYVPSCIDERKALERAQQRLKLAEDKAEAVKKWTRALQHELNEYAGRMAQFNALLEIDLPKATASLERVLAALDDYISTKALRPMAEPRLGEVESSGSMAMPREERDDQNTRLTEQSDSVVGVEVGAPPIDESNLTSDSPAVHEESPS